MIKNLKCQPWLEIFVAFCLNCFFYVCFEGQMMLARVPKKKRGEGGNKVKTSVQETEMLCSSTITTFS